MLDEVSKELNEFKEKTVQLRTNVDQALQQLDSDFNILTK